MGQSEGCWVPEALGEQDSSFLGSSQQSWFGPTAKMGTQRPEGQGPWDHIAVRPRLPVPPDSPGGAELP